MKTTLIALAALTLSATASASPANYKFVALDDSASTNICIASALLGLDAAKEIAAGDFSKRTLCNGMYISSFAAKYSQPAKVSVEEAATKVKFVAADNNDASLLCVKAANQGVKALGLNRQEMQEISCNGRNIVRFAKAYASK